MERHEQLSRSMCTCGWQGDDFMVHERDVLAPGKEIAFKAAQSRIDHLEAEVARLTEELANAPREVRMDEMTANDELFHDGGFVPVESVGQYNEGVDVITEVSYSRDGRTWATDSISSHKTIVRRKCRTPEQEQREREIEVIVKTINADIPSFAGVEKLAEKVVDGLAALHEENK